MAQLQLLVLSYVLLTALRDFRDNFAAEIWAAMGFGEASDVFTASELPDYLPMFLEFLGQQPLDEERRMLGDIGHIVAALHARLVKRGSAYAAPLAALLGCIPIRGPSRRPTIPARIGPIASTGHRCRACPGRMIPSHRTRSRSSSTGDP